MVTFILYFIKYLILVVPILILVAFFTLLERKVIGSIQYRRGPNLVGILGLLQPFADALKLLIKEPLTPSNANTLLFLFAPMFTLLLSLILWSLMPFDETVVFSDLNLGVMAVLAISSLSVYGVILAGWSSNSKYAFLGALRSSSQMISYEVSMGIQLITVLLAVGSLNLQEIVLKQEDSVYFCLPFAPIFILFFITTVAETNRHPFDLPEAEAELVSGYNIEYSAVGFAFFFIAEYANILFMCGLNVIFFFGGWLPIPFISFFLPNLPPVFWFSFKLLIFVLLFIWLRAMLPRYRYDQLMTLGWKVILPLSLGLLWFYASIFVSFGWLSF